MRKNVFIGILAVLSLLLVGGVLAMADQESTTAQVDKTWELTAQTITRQPDWKNQPMPFSCPTSIKKSILINPQPLLERGFFCWAKKE